jgi:hypothetical protein
MAVPAGAMTGRFSAAAVGKRKRAGKSVLGEMEPGQEAACTASEPGRNRAAGKRDLGVVHLPVIIPSDID